MKQITYIWLAIIALVMASLLAGCSEEKKEYYGAAPQGKVTMAPDEDAVYVNTRVAFRAPADASTIEVYVNKEYIDTGGIVLYTPARAGKILVEAYLHGLPNTGAGYWYKEIEVKDSSCLNVSVTWPQVYTDADGDQYVTATGSYSWAYPECISEPVETKWLIDCIECEQCRESSTIRKELGSGLHVVMYCVVAANGLERCADATVEVP